MANRKKKDEALAVVQAQTEGSGQPAVQSGYSAAGLDSRSEVENALANSSYKPSQTVTDAADALKEWQANRPGDYQSSYQERIDQLLNQLLQRESFQYSYTKDPLYRQYEQNYLQNAHNASADAAAQAAALTGGYGSSYATSAAQQAYQQQIGALSSAIPTLYSLALDTYTSGGNELVSQLDQLNNSEQDAQQQYNNKLSDYYTQLQQKGEAYNNAYAQDYGKYQDYLSQLHSGQHDGTDGHAAGRYGHCRKAAAGGVLHPPQLSAHSAASGGMPAGGSGAAVGLPCIQLGGRRQEHPDDGLPCRHHPCLCYCYLHGSAL